MIIDCHCHLFYENNLESIKALQNKFVNFENYSFYKRMINEVMKVNSISTEDIIEKTVYHAKKAGFDKIVLLPLSVNENKIVKEWSKRYPQLFIPFYNPPEKSNYDQILTDVSTALEKDNYKGLKIMLPFRKKFLNDKSLFAAWEIAENKKVPVIFHTGYPPPGTKKFVLKYANPIYLEDVIESYPNLNIIIAHMGFPFVNIALSLAVQCPNIYVDVSNLMYMQPNNLKNLLLQAKEMIGVNKIIFGSDAFCPEMLETTIQYFHKIEFLTKTEIEKIIGLNAKKILKI